MTVFNLPAKDAHAFLRSRIEKWKSPLTLSWEKTGITLPVNIDIAEEGDIFHVTISNDSTNILAREKVC